MKMLDRTLAAEIVYKLGQIPADATPRWGKMSRDQLYGHLALVMRHMLAQTPPLPFKGNWKSRHIFRHLILNGIVEIPHNIRLPRPTGLPKGEELVPPTCSLEDFQRALDEYLSAAESGSLPPAMHPFFGLLTVTEWRKFHIAHFKHHLKQFGVWDLPVPR